MAPVTLFRGLALSTSVQGRRQVVRCAFAMNALRSGLPGMLIQPRCNYRLFGPGTCGLSREAFALNVTVDTLDGRTLTVAGAGLAGKGANHFAEGWIGERTATNEQARPVPYFAGITRLGVTFLSEAFNVSAQKVQTRVGKKKQIHPESDQSPPDRGRGRAVAATVVADGRRRDPG